MSKFSVIGATIQIEGLLIPGGLTLDQLPTEGEMFTVPAVDHVVSSRSTNGALITHSTVPDYEATFTLHADSEQRRRLDAAIAASIAVGNAFRNSCTITFTRREGSKIRVDTFLGCVFTSSSPVPSVSGSIVENGSYTFKFENVVRL
jgi:hypothetical protein